MQLVFLASTKKDLRWFTHYYRTVFPEGASQAQQQFISFKQLIKANPHAGHTSVTLDGARELPIARTPFTIVYRVTDTHIEILRVWDQRQGDAP